MRCKDSIGEEDAKALLAEPRRKFRGQEKDDRRVGISSAREQVSSDFKNSASATLHETLGSAPSLGLRGSFPKD